jgi:hypothetical protein
MLPYKILTSGHVHYANRTVHSKCRKPSEILKKIDIQENVEAKQHIKMSILNTRIWKSNSSLEGF